jgi:hypothetical protein
MTEEKKLQVKNYGFGIFLMISTLCLILIHKLFFTNIHYKSGLIGNAFYAFGIMLWSLFFWLVLIMFSIGATIGIIGAIIKTIKARKVEWLKLFLMFLPLLCLFAYFISNAFLNEPGPGAWHFLRGYEKWVEKNVDISVIQEWLISLPPEYSGQSYFEASEFPKELPDAITKLEPNHMVLSDCKDGQRQILFEWGCGLGHFGIVIGLPGMETPKEEELIKHSESDWEYRRPIQSGVYIFDRG